MTVFNKPENIHAELETLRRMKKNIGMQLLLLILLLVFAMFTYKANHTVSYAAGFVALLFELLFIIPSRKRRKHRIISSMCLLGLGAPISDCTYRRKQNMEGDILRQKGLSAGEKWTQVAVSRHIVSGVYGETKVSVCECGVSFQRGQGKGDLDFLNGTLFTAESKAAESNIVCLSRELPHIQLWEEDFIRAGYNVHDFQSRSLNGEYMLLVNRGASPAWLEQSLKRLSKQSAAPMLVSINDKGLSVFLLNRFYTGKQPALADINEGYLSCCRLPERDALLEMVDKHR